MHHCTSWLSICSLVLTKRIYFRIDMTNITRKSLKHFYSRSEVHPWSLLAFPWLEVRIAHIVLPSMGIQMTTPANGVYSRWPRLFNGLSLGQFGQDSSALSGSKTRKNDPMTSVISTKYGHALYNRIMSCTIWKTKTRRIRYNCP